MVHEIFRFSQVGSIGFIRYYLCFISFVCGFHFHGYAQLTEQQRLYQTGLIEMEAKGDYPKAIELFKKVLGSKTNDRSLLARTHLQLGK